MSSRSFTAPADGFGTLRQFARRERPLERCELCSVGLTPGHPHLIELERRKLLCTCDACAILFSRQGAARYKRVPRRIRSLRDFHLSDEQWEALSIPIGLAFFFHSSPLDRVVAFYPSPAGATESLLPLDSWRGLVARNQELATMRPDVEALLVWGSGALRGDGATEESVECFLVPIDVCYELVGELRRQWRGFDGGTEVHATLAEFFARVRSRAGTEVDR